MNSKPVFNGLTNKDASIFYHFLCIYEQKVKPFLATTTFRQRNPNVARLIDSMDITILPKSQYSAIPNKIHQGEKLILLGDEKKVYKEFFRHLRNALAHGLLERKRDYYVFMDVGDVKLSKTETKKNQKTACCRVEKGKIDNILIDIIIETIKEQRFRS